MGTQLPHVDVPSSVACLAGIIRTGPADPPSYIPRHSPALDQHATRRPIARYIGAYARCSASLLHPAFSGHPSQTHNTSGRCSDRWVHCSLDPPPLGKEHSPSCQQPGSNLYIIIIVLLHRQGSRTSSTPRYAVPDATSRPSQQRSTSVHVESHCVSYEPDDAGNVTPLAVRPTALRNVWHTCAVVD